MNQHKLEGRTGEGASPVGWLVQSPAYFVCQRLKPGCAQQLVGGGNDPECVVESTKRMTNQTSRGEDSGKQAERGGGNGVVRATNMGKRWWMGG